MKVAAILLLGLGGAVRLRQYAARTSFWRDEAFVVLNVRDLSAAQLLGKLKWDQAAPPLFLWSLKGLANVFGESELTLRLVPLACSLMALGVFGVLAWRLLPEPAALFAISLFAFCRILIEYSAEVKQYSGDALVSGIIILIAVGRCGVSPLRRLAWSAAVAAVVVWFSHTTAIVFGGVSLVLSVACLGRGRREAIWAAAWNALFVASFAALFFLSIRRQHTDFLYRFWQRAFPDWDHPLTFPLWLARQGFELCQGPYRWAGPIFVPLIVAGLFWARRRREWEWWTACAVPLILVVVAATVREYPFGGGRLTLFLLPELFLLIGAGAALLWELLPHAWRPAWWLLPLILGGQGIGSAAVRLVHPIFKSHIRPAVAFVRERRRPGEGLILAGQPSDRDPGFAFGGRNLETLCYWPRPPAPVYIKLSSLNEVREARFWVLAAFTPYQAHGLDPLLRQFRAIAVERDRFVVKQGGAAYLFERPEGADERTGPLGRGAETSKSALTQSLPSERVHAHP